MVSPLVALVDDVAGDGPGFQDGIFASENEQKHTLANVFRVWGKVLQNIITKQFPCAAMALVGIRNRVPHKLLNQLAAGCKHAGSYQFQTRSRQNSRNNSPGSRFTDRIRCYENVREFHSASRQDGAGNRS